MVAVRFISSQNGAGYKENVSPPRMRRKYLHTRQPSSIVPTITCLCVHLYDTMKIMIEDAQDHALRCPHAKGRNEVRMVQEE
jgi:hypothetical protein